MAQPTIIDTCRALHAHMLTFSKSPMLALNPRGKVAFELMGSLLTQLGDLADRVELLEASYRNNHHPHEIRAVEQANQHPNR
jgi:hypothetical protein